MPDFVYYGVLFLHNTIEVHPTKGCAGLKNDGHADSLWSYGKGLQKEKPACPRAYFTMLSGFEATAT
jgi:hypothetical protein